MPSAKTLTLDTKTNRILLIAAMFDPPPPGTPPLSNGRIARGPMQAGFVLHFDGGQVDGLPEELILGSDGSASSSIRGILSVTAERHNMNRHSGRRNQDSGQGPDRDLVQLLADRRAKRFQMMPMTKPSAYPIQVVTT